MDGNIKTQISVKQAQKIINISTFIEDQMEKLIEKLDELEMTPEVDEISHIIEKYSNFNEVITNKLKPIIYDAKNE